LLQCFEYADGRMPVAMTRAGARYYLAYDQVGSLRAVMDGAGNVVKRIDYDTFGNVLADSNADFEAPFGFAGGLYDGDTGLVRFGYRDYDADTGRWTAKDPIGFKGNNTDLFSYCRNNVINRTDRFGLWDYASEHGTNGEGLTEYISGIENQVDQAFNDIAGRDAVVTYTTNGQHSPNSLHYSGNACDLRTRDLTEDQVQELTEQLRQSLGDNYDVLFEGNHFHIEYDPN